MSAADVLNAQAYTILDRYQKALNEVASPLVTPKERWEGCRRQAEAVLGECVAVLCGDTERHGEAYTFTRDLSAQWILRHVPIADALRAGMLLWHSAVAVLRESLPAQEASCEPQLSAAMESLHDAIGLQLHIGMLANEHANLVHQVTATDMPTPEPGVELRVAADTAARDPLTSRERQVLEAVARAQSNRAIARELGVTETTVKSHLQRIFRKLDATSRVDAITRAGIYPKLSSDRTPRWPGKIASLDSRRAGA